MSKKSNEFQNVKKTNSEGKSVNKGKKPVSSKFKKGFNKENFVESLKSVEKIKPKSDNLYKNKSQKKLGNVGIEDIDNREKKEKVLKDKFNNKLVSKKKTSNIEEKLVWKPSCLLSPAPAIMVSCGDEIKSNIITIAWAGTINSTPPMVSISIRKSRFSYEIIKRTKEFVINMPNSDLAYETDFCGIKSGKDIDKFDVLGLTKGKSTKVQTPYIAECPINIECKVKKIIEMQSHDMFIAEIVSINLNKDLVNSKERLCIDKADLIAYSHGEYFDMGKSLGHFGFSVRKKKVAKKRKIK